MTRAATAFDRFATILVGFALLAVGVLAVGWHRGLIGGGRPLRPLLEQPESSAWWPWVTGGVGLLLVLLGLRWLATHHPAVKARRVGLDRRQPEFTADAAAVATAAGSALAADPAIHAAKGTATVQQGVPTVTLEATVSARHGLTAGVRAADQVAGAVAGMLGDAVAVRTVMHVDRKRGTPVR